MGFKLLVSKKAQKDLDHLDQQAAARVVKKLRWISEQANLASFSVIMKETSAGDLRFRIGDYRAIGVFNFDHTQIMIISIGHRSSIYRF